MAILYYAITIIMLFSLFKASEQKKKMHSRGKYLCLFISARFIVKNTFHLAYIETYTMLKTTWKNVRDAENAWRNKSNSNRS